MIKKILRFIFSRLIEICKKLLKKKYSTDSYKEENPKPKPKPKKKYTKTIFPYIDFMVGYVPWDLHGFVIPFKDGSSWTFRQFDNAAELLAKHGVNAIRLFAYCLEDKKSFLSFIHPIPDHKGKFVFTYDSQGFLKLDEKYKVEMHRRLDCFHKRKIKTIICLASGIKGHRYKWTMWSRNYLDLPDDYKKFFTTKAVRMLFRDYVRAMVKEFDNPLVIWEVINEPQGINPSVLDAWLTNIVDYITKGLRVPQKRIMIEHIDSSITLEWLKRWKKVLYSHHGINTAWAFNRYHLKGCEFQKYFYKPYGRRIISDSDGAQTWDEKLVGRGLRGWNWNKEFSRPASWDMMIGLITDYVAGGGGWIIMSAGAWAKKTNVPNMSFWKYCALEGLTEKEAWKFGIDYKLNKLPELKAIRRAVDKIIEG